MIEVLVSNQITGTINNNLIKDNKNEIINPWWTECSPYLLKIILAYKLCV